MAFQVSAWLGISLLLKSEKAAKLAEMFGQTGYSIRDISCSIWGTTRRRSNSCTTYMLGNSVNPVYSHQVVTQSLRVYQCLLQVTLRVFLIDFLLLWRPSIFSPTLHKDSLRHVCPVLVCRCLHLLQTGAGCLLSEYKYAKLLSESIRKYFLSNIRDWCLAMGYVSILAGYIVLPFPHSLFHLFTCISCRQDKHCVERILVQCVSLTPHQGSCLAAYLIAICFR